MKTKLLFISALILAAVVTNAQTTITRTVNAGLDDHAEHIMGANPQNGTTGAMYVGGTSIALGNELPQANPTMAGFRFTNITIPKFATIISASIKFTVKGTTNNTDPCNLLIYAENSANAATFSDNATSLSGRPLASGSIAWAVSGASWGTVGSSGADQTTSSITSLVQPLVFQPAWASGNAMAFFIKGAGVREIESFESNPSHAAELVITYSAAGTPTTPGNTTGVIELTTASSVNVYPNPFKGSFNVNIEVASASDVQISTYDLTGKLVDEKSIKQAPQGTLHYTTASELRAGMYFVKVLANGKQETIKMIAE